MAKKKRLLITDELAWYESQVQEFKNYITNIKLENLVDRIAAKPTKNGGVVSQVVTIEDQANHKMKILNEIPKLIAELNELKNLGDSEDEKIETRGDIDVPDIMK